jgi:CRISPR/Cas system-associated exonuclease Cas4 (RecB family)
MNLFSQEAKSLGPWSPTKVSMLEGCSRKFEWSYVRKRYLEEDEVYPTDKSALEMGKGIHKYAELLKEGTALDSAQDAALNEVQIEMSEPQRAKIHSAFESVRGFEERLTKFKQAHDVVEDLAECRFAAMPDMTGTYFFNNSGIIRGVLDRCIIVNKNGGLHAIAIDIKTGKVNNITDHEIQLSTYGMLLHANKRGLHTVQTAIYFTENSQLVWNPLKMTRKFALSEENPSVTKINQLSKAYYDTGAAPTRTRLCEWCTFKRVCDKE